MKKIKTAMALGALFSASLTHASMDELAKGFANPPNGSKPFTWWHWMSSNVSKEGIVKDLEAMKAAGIGGFTLFNVQPQQTAVGNVKFWGKEWLQALDLTAATAERLGLDFTYHASAGFATTAAECITPEMAMQQIVWTETKANGPSKITLPRFTVEGNKCAPLVWTINDSQPEQHPKKERWQNEYYRDTFVIAFPTPQDELGENAKPHRLADWNVKAGFGKRERYYSPNFPAEDESRAPFPIALESVLNLTKKMSPDGALDWTPPDAREWTVLRFGHTITGMQNHPAPEGGRGLECDKYSKEAANFFFDNAVKPIMDRVNHGGKKRISTLLVDSYEAREQNWTKLMPSEFHRLRGYHLVRLLPACTGRVIESTQFTEKFLRDLRRTFAELTAENHYTELAKRCHESGLLFATEGYGWPSPFDAILTSMTADIPMGEYWTGSSASKTNTSIKIAQSAAVFGNRSVVPVEAFTSARGEKMYEDHPATYKAQGDYFLTFGMNRTTLHCFPHQPFADNMGPGMSMWYWGSLFHRNNIWYPKATGWFKYLARAQHILQRGKLVADMALYYGENTPAVLDATHSLGIPNEQLNRGFVPECNVYPKGFKEVKVGNDYVLCDSAVLMEFEPLADGGFVHKKSGSTFKLLYVKPESNMRLAVLDHILKLVKGGANVIMQTPDHTFGLGEMKDEAALFGKLIGEMRSLQNSPAKARIFNGDTSPEDALSAIGVKKDFEFINADKTQKATVRYIHKIIDGTDFYFVANLENEWVEGELIFRVSGKPAQIWNPENGEISDAVAWKYTDDGRTSIRVKLPPAASMFYVFTDKPANAHITGLDAGLETAQLGGKRFFKSYSNGAFKAKYANGVQKEISFTGIAGNIDLSAGWVLTFPKDVAENNSVRMEKLASYTTLEHYDMKH